MAKTLWVLGASDPEMERIRAVLVEHGEQVVAAHVADQRTGKLRPVRPPEAYGHGIVAGDAGPPLLRGEYDRLTVVECSARAIVDAEPEWSGAVVVVDHHNPGDPGYGRRHDEFLAASSLGQVLALLGKRHGSEHGPLGRWESPGRLAAHPEGGAFAFEHGSWHLGVRGTGCGDDGQDDGYHRIGTGYARWVRIPEELVLTAAADQCLAAAYAGECPGVDPDDLMHWRAASRSAFQRRPVADIEADIDAAREALSSAPVLNVVAGVPVRDMRAERPVPELPEAAARDGVAYVSGPLVDQDGRQKFTASGPPEVIRAFLSGELLPGLQSLYGDPARGFAGGYL